MQLIQPGSLEEAIQVLEQHEWDAKIVAGGTALVLMMQQDLIAPEVLVGVQRIPGMNAIHKDNGAVQIGSNATLSDVAASPLIQQHYPSLAYACHRVGNIRIRNAATLGGNLAEADYASDPPSVLAALDATVQIAGPEGTRETSIDDLLEGFYTTTLEPAEIVTGVRLPDRQAGNSYDVYLKYISRSSEDRPCIGVAAAADFSSEQPGVVQRLRVAIGAAAAVPQRFPEVEQLAANQALDEDTIDRVASGYAESISPLDDLRGSAWYRQQMVKVFVGRALRALREQRAVANGGNEGK